MTIFKCLNKSCNFTQEYFNDDDEPWACPKCESKWYCIRFCGDKEPEDVSKINWYEKDNPRWSTSMGVPAGQVKQFRERFPNSVYDDNGRLYIKNRVDKKRQMAERFMYEQD